MVEATTVHHVFPRDQFPELEWCTWNMISLSQEMHNRMHDRETGRLTKEGRDLLLRIARREGKEDLIPPT